MSYVLNFIIYSSVIVNSILYVDEIIGDYQ
jgi:hypothetical protein